MTAHSSELKTKKKKALKDGDKSVFIIFKYWRKTLYFVSEMTGDTGHVLLRIHITAATLSFSCSFSSETLAGNAGYR